MAKVFNYENYVKNLPDAYRKDKDSNNYKILAIEQHSAQKLYKDINDVFNSLDIWQATGKTLDLYGEMYNLTRGNLTDEQYRMNILLRIAQSRAGGSHTSIVKALSAAMGVPVENFRLKDGKTSGNVVIDQLPYDVFQNAGIEPLKVLDMLKAFLGAGIGVESFSISQDVEEACLRIANAIIHGETFICKIEPTMTDTVSTILNPVFVITQNETNEVEVK